MSRFFTRPWLGVISLLLCGLLAMATHVPAAEDNYRLGTQGEVLDDRVMYTIGGGSAVGSPSSLYRPSGLGVGGMDMRSNGDQSVEQQTHHAQQWSRARPAHDAPPSKSMLNRKVCPSRLQQR